MLIAVSLALDLAVSPVPNPISREAMMKTSWKVNSTKRKSSL